MNETPLPITVRATMTLGASVRAMERFTAA